MDPFVLAAGTAVVNAMATQSWEQACSAVAALWRRIQPERAAKVDAELAEVRIKVLAARERGDDETEQALVWAWRLQLQQLLDENPALRPELKLLLDEHLTPALPLGERAQIQQIVINARAQDHARQNIAGRDLHISES